MLPIVLHILLKNGIIILLQHFTIAIIIAVFRKIVVYVSFIAIPSVFSIYFESAASLHQIT
jgi:hypothetical protein